MTDRSATVCQSTANGSSSWIAPADVQNDINDNNQCTPAVCQRVFCAMGAFSTSDIWINTKKRLRKWDATGDPARRATDLESVVLHEMGHWLALGPRSRCPGRPSARSCPAMPKRTLFDNDRRGIEFIYPCPPTTCRATRRLNRRAGLPPLRRLTVTPAPTITPTPTITPIADPATQSLDRWWRWISCRQMTAR